MSAMNVMNEAPRIDPEFAALMPSLTEEEYAQLERNIISQKKCLDKILLWDGVIVDGVNRFCASVANGVEFEIDTNSD